MANSCSVLRGSAEALGSVSTAGRTSATGGAVVRAIVITWVFLLFPPGAAAQTPGSERCPELRAFVDSLLEDAWNESVLRHSSVDSARFVLLQSAVFLDSRFFGLTSLAEIADSLESISRQLGSVLGINPDNSALTDQKLGLLQRRFQTKTSFQRLLVSGSGIRELVERETLIIAATILGQEAALLAAPIQELFHFSDDVREFTGNPDREDLRLRVAGMVGRAESAMIRYRNLLQVSGRGSLSRARLRHAVKDFCDPVSAND